MADVFISYSHKDSVWVRGTLVPKLRNHSFAVFIDYEDFRAGAFSPEEMQRAVETTTRTLIVLTPNYVESEWCLLENVIAQTSDPGAMARKLIPVLRESCNIPLRLKVLHHRDLRQDSADEWDRLIRDLI
jgi:hypothetical protein